MSDLIHAHCALLRTGKSPRTVDARDYWLRRADTELPCGLLEATQVEIAAWIGRDDWAPATKAKVIYHLSEFFRWGCDPDSGVDGPVLADDPMAKIIRPRVPKGEPRPVTDEELDTVLSRSREPHLTEAVLAYGVGLRATELALIRREEITEAWTWVRRGKGGRAASVPTSEIVWSHVHDFPRGYVVEHVGGIADGRKTSHRAAIYFSRTLGLPGVSLHRLRHTFAAHLREGGADIATISKALRHRNLSSTQVYAGATEEECRRAVQALLPSTPTKKQQP